MNDTAGDSYDKIIGEMGFAWDRRGPAISSAEVLDWYNRLTALQSTGSQTIESAPKDGAEDYEFFVAQGIANSPEPLRELGRYLARVMDEDQFETANRLLLQIATADRRPLPAPPRKNKDG